MYGRNVGQFAQICRENEIRRCEAVYIAVVLQPFLPFSATRQAFKHSIPTAHLARGRETSGRPSVLVAVFRLSWNAGHAGCAAPSHSPSTYTYLSPLPPSAPSPYFFGAPLGRSAACVAAFLCHALSPGRVCAANKNGTRRYHGFSS